MAEAEYDDFGGQGSQRAGLASSLVQRAGHRRGSLPCMQATTSAPRSTTARWEIGLAAVDSPARLGTCCCAPGPCANARPAPLAQEEDEQHQQQRHGGYDDEDGVLEDVNGAGVHDAMDEGKSAWLPVAAITLQLLGQI
jgi:hypothetical protein